MKKYYVAFAVLAAVMTACGGNDAKKEEKKTETATAAPAATDLSANPDYQKGLELVAKNDCLTCHKVSEKNIGPAYKDVAAKYENTDANISMLVAKVIKGGQGVWGTVPMTPHPQLSEADAQQIIKYIFLLKNK